MVFVGMEGKLHLYEHGHQDKLQALKNVFKHHQMGLLIMKICCGKLSFDTLGCDKALALLKLHSPPQFECLIS
jgi:hypothetical protein